LSELRLIQAQIPRLLEFDIRICVAFSRNRVNPSVRVADTYISSVPVIKHICIPNLTSEDNRAEKNIQKGDLIIHET